MSKLHRLANMAICLLTLSFSSAFAAGPQSAEQLEAEAVVDRYYAALIRGDVTTVKPLLGGNFLRRSSPHLDNPRYRNFLIKRYASAQYEILNSTVIDHDNVQVTVRIALNADENFESKLHLMRDSAPDSADPTFHIIHEEQ